MKNLKERFIWDFNNLESPKLVTVAVQLPSGAIETITNNTFLKEKCEYYISMYNENFELVHNNNVKIVGYMLI